VLLVHGIYDSARSMGIMAHWLREQGWEVHTLSLAPNDGGCGLDELAQQVGAYVGRTFQKGRKIDLVGFSMGGMVCRYYVQRLGGERKVERFIAISAPNHGSWLAWLSNKPGCVQMRPGSAFLQALNTDVEPLQRVQFSSIWSPLDLVILPAKSSRMPVGAEMRKWVVAHPLMVLYPGCLWAVAGMLSKPRSAARLALKSCDAC